jgi:aminoglycoside 6'-N-acetyltransferase
MICDVATQVELRDVHPDDLPVLFEHQRDPEAIRMAAFPSREWSTFLAHWTRILADDSVTKRAIVADGVVAGNIVSWTEDGARLVGYWLGREHWGRGIASEALRRFVAVETTRPLVAHAARHNAASIRVLRKAGFELAEERPVEGEDRLEVLLRLDRPAGALAGNEVLLRRLRAEDRERMREMLDQPEVADRWLGSRALDEAVEELFEADEVVPFAITVAGAVIGYIQYGEETDRDYRSASIDVFLDRAWHGRGLGPDAVATLVRHLVRDLGHHRVTIDPAASNERAIRAYRRVGFRPVGVMRAYERGRDGTWHDGLLMDLLADDLDQPDVG